MANFYSQYPASSGGSSTNPSVGTNGTTAPTSSTEVAGINPSGNLQPLQTDSSGSLYVNIGSDLSPVTVIQPNGANLHVDIDASALPNGAATAALQTNANTSLSTILAQQTNGTQITQVSSSVLPTGAATAALQINGNSSLSTILAQQTNGTQITQVSSSALPTGASTSALQSAIQSAPGTAQTTAVTIQGNASAIPVPVSGTITTSSPSVGPTATTAPTSATEVGAVDSSGNLQALTIDGSGNLNVRIVAPIGPQHNSTAIPVVLATGSIVQVSGTTQPGSANYTGSVTNTGDTTNGGSPGYGTMSIRVSGTWSGVLTPQVTPDGSIYVPTSVINVATGASQSTITANGTYLLNVAGFSNTQILATSMASGTASINFLATASSSVDYVTGTSAAGSGASTGLITVQGNASGTPIPVTGSITTSNPAVGTVGATAPTSANQIGGVYNAVLPTLSSGQMGAAQLDTNSRIIAVGAGVAGSPSGGVLTVQGSASGQALPVSINSSITVPVSGVVIADIKDTAGNAIYANGSGALTVTGAQAAGVPGSTALTVQGIGGGTPMPISAASLPLPTGAATSANQTTEIGYLSTIATNTGAQATDITTTGTITALNGTVSISGQGVYTTTFSITGTWVATLVVEGQTPDSNWTQIPINIVASQLPYQQMPSVSTNGTYLITGGGFTNIRIRASAFTSGTVAVAIDGSLAQQTVIANISTPDLAVTGASAQTAVVNNILTTTSGTAATYVGGFHSANIQVNSTGTAGTYIFEGSNDNVNFVTIPVYNGLVITGTPITAAVTASATNIVYTFPITTNYIRLRIATAITGGSIQAFSKFSQTSWTPTVAQVAQATAGNLNTTATIASGTVTTVSTVTSVTAVANSTTALPAAQVADISAVAFTVTTTSAAITPTAGCAYVFEHFLTAYTSGSVQVTIQETTDGTEWHNVYSFPPLASTTSYQVSPPLMFNGKQIRYVSSGPTSVLTHTVNRTMMSQTAQLPYKSLIDVGSGNGGTINPATTGSTTGVLPVEGLNNYTMIVNQGTGGSAVTFNLQGTVDNTNWVNLATAIGVVGGATPVTVTYQGAAMVAIRAQVVTGVASTTISSIFLSANIAQGAIRPANGALTDNSGTTSATANTSTQIMGVNYARKYLLIQNTSGNTMWINFTSAATTTQPSIELLAGGSLVQESSFVSTEAVNVICSVASQTYTAKQA